MFHDEAKAERDHGQFNCNPMTSIKLSLDWIEMPKQAENLMHDKQRLRRSLSPNYVHTGRTNIRTHSSHNT